MHDPAAPVTPVTTPTRRAQATARSFWQTVRLVIWSVILIVLLAFIVQNLDYVELRVLNWERRVRLAWVLLVAGILGYILGWLRPRFRRR